MLFLSSLVVASYFFCLKAFVRMRSSDHLGDAKMSKKATRSVEFNFFTNCDRQKLPVDLSAIQNIGSCETIWNLVFDNPAGNIKNSKCCLQAQLFSVFSWHAEVIGMHAAGVARGY